MYYYNLQVLKLTTSFAGALSSMSGTIADVSDALGRNTRFGASNFALHLGMIVSLMLFAIHLAAMQPILLLTPGRDPDDEHSLVSFGSFVLHRQNPDEPTPHDEP